MNALISRKIEISEYSKVIFKELPGLVINSINKSQIRPIYSDYSLEELVADRKGSILIIEGDCDPHNLTLDDDFKLSFYHYNSLYQVDHYDDVNFYCVAGACYRENTKAANAEFLTKDFVDYIENRYLHTLKSIKEADVIYDMTKNTMRGFQGWN